MATLSQTSLPKTANPVQKQDILQKPKTPQNQQKANPTPAYLQAKLAVSTPGDRHEQEADRMADSIMRSPTNGQISKSSEQVQTSGLKPGISSVTEADKAQKLARSALTSGGDETLQRSSLQPGSLQRSSLQPSTDETAQRSRDETVAKAASQTPAQSLQKQESNQSNPNINQNNQQVSSADNEQVSAIPQATEARIQAARGNGNPLPDTSKGEMEQQFVADFSGVVIHTDSEADALSQSIQAKAFTVGNDIFFAAGRYQPETAEGKRLLAHELTHVVQQNGGSDEVMRDDDTGSSNSNVIMTDTLYQDPVKGTIDVANSRILIPHVNFPKVKAFFTNTGFLQVRPAREEGVARQTEQRSKWDSHVKESAQLRQKLHEKVEGAAPFREPGQTVDRYYLRVGRSRGDDSSYLVGTESQILQRIARPYWTKRGTISRNTMLQVDHQQEWQLMGSDTLDNYWLLDSRTNQASGTNIHNSIATKIRELLRASKAAGFNPTGPLAGWRDAIISSGRSSDEYKEFRRRFHFTIARSEFNAAPRRARTSYSLDEATNQGKQVDPLRPMTLRQVQRAGLAAGDTDFIIFNNSSGGRRHRLTMGTNQENEIEFTDRSFIPGFYPSKAIIDPDGTPMMRIEGKLFLDNPKLNFHNTPTYIEISRMEGIPHTGYINFTKWRREVRALFDDASQAGLADLSPIQVDAMSFNEMNEFEITGRVTPSIPMIRNADLRVAIRGDDVRLEKTFNTGDFDLPGPVEITESSLTVAIGTRSGFSMNGRVGLLIQQLGEGGIEADARTGRGGENGSAFALSGYFDFDTSLFDEARIEVSYRDNILSGNGTLTIGRGKIAGIRGASLTASVEGETWSATGIVEPDIPGIEQGTLSVVYDPETGMVITGTLALSSDIPGVRQGNLEASLSKDTDEVWKLAASGNILLDIPGIDSAISAAYNDGAFTAEGNIAYQRGMLDGHATIGVTNHILDDQGNPTETAGDTLHIYGGGELALQIAPWLQATAGVQFSPSGEIAVSGEIRLHDQLQLFPCYPLSKTLLSLNFPIPIVPGLSAEIGGSLTANAGIGPGVIDQLRLGVEYNPAHEEDTHVTGDIHLNIPANAGLRLAVSVGLSIGIPGARVSGGLEIGGELGLQGLAEAGAHVDWMPSQGLEITAFGRLSVQPKFVFDISGYVTAKALFYTVYDETWQLASYEYGSNMTFGILFPIHYVEGQPFDISLDDVEFQVPEVSPEDILSGLIDRIT